jgi:hypothetical protein
VTQPMSEGQLPVVELPAAGSLQRRGSPEDPRLAKIGPHVDRYRRSTTSSKPDPCTACRCQDLIVNRYADRLDPGTYAEDPIVWVGRDTLDGLSVPERVFWRLAAVAKAYDLHLLPLLGESEPIELAKPMAETLIDEVSFVMDRLNDPVVELWGRGSSTLLQQLCGSPATIGSPLKASSRQQQVSPRDRPPGWFRGRLCWWSRPGRAAVCAGFALRGPPPPCSLERPTGPCRSWLEYRVNICLL